LLLLNQEIEPAAAVLIDSGNVNEALGLYKSMEMWEPMIQTARSNGVDTIETLKREYLQWLKDTSQEGLAGELKEAEGDIQGAIRLYVQNGFPNRAAALLIRMGANSNEDLVESVASALLRAELPEKAGALFENVGQTERALEAYIQGKAYRAAVELCRQIRPTKVVELEEVRRKSLTTVALPESI